ncbi:MAG: MBL fold metallo-hydrolase [Burkholderiaceae bacterium]
MIRFRSLGSGSSGNATLVEAGDGGHTTRLLVDCGFTQRELAQRLAASGLAAEDLDAIFITHEHADHVGCAVPLARRHDIALWTSRGTWRAIGEPDLPGLLHYARDAEPIDLGGLQLHPYTVPHDAIEPLQLRCSDGATQLGILTDAGSITPHVVAQLQACDALLIECNHDVELLSASRYPPSLKARIGGRYGHLCNDTAAQILAACTHAGLLHVVAAHLSEQNNRPDLARDALARACGRRGDEIVVADPRAGFDWLALA